MALPRAYTDVVGCSLPVQQAPMGSAAGPDLAVAVAEAGGVGTITALGMRPHQLAAVLDDMAARTSGVLAANFLTADVDPEAVVVAARTGLVDFFWRDPDPALVDVAHRGGARVCWQVGSLDEARAAADAGCDVIAVQGAEAGGHVRGGTPLLPLLSAVLDAVDVPVLAAGGIGDARAMAAAIAAGAAGVRMGTRFLATPESGAHPHYKEAVIEATFGDTAITDAFSQCPLCATSARARVLRRCIDALAHVEGDEVGSTTFGRTTVVVPRRSGLSPSATSTGQLEAMALYAGESSAVIADIVPAGRLVAELCAEADRLLRAAAGA